MSEDPNKTSQDPNNQGNQPPPAVSKEKLAEISKELGTNVVLESDLLTVKGSLGDKLKNAEQAVVTANSATEAAKTAQSEAQQKAYQLEAKVQELEQQVQEGTGSKEELETVKQQLVNAQESVAGANTKLLEARKQLIIATFHVTPDSVENKTIEQLDAYEEALKAVAATKGIGNFAVATATGPGQVPTSGREKIKLGFDELHPQS